MANKEAVCREQNQECPVDIDTGISAGKGRTKYSLKQSSRVVISEKLQ